MSYAPPGRFRGFFSSRTGIALSVIGALCLAGATAFALRGGGGSDHEAILPPTTTTTVTAPPLQQEGSVLLGASISTDTRSLSGEKSAVGELEQAIGRTLDIHHNFYTWDESFPTELERSDLQNGRIPMISWNGRGVTTRAIAAGRYDDLIEQRARDTKALGQPVLVRWFWEMDGNKKAEFAGTPDEYIAAWKHIVGTFRAQGADNVRWVWCPNASAFNDGEAQAFYPGPEFVDWTCADGYNWAPGRAGDDYRSFKDIFSGFYLWAASAEQADHGG